MYIFRGHGVINWYIDIMCNNQIKTIFLQRRGASSQGQGGDSTSIILHQSATAKGSWGDHHPVHLGFTSPVVLQRAPLVWALLATNLMFFSDLGSTTTFLQTVDLILAPELPSLGNVEGWGRQRERGKLIISEEGRQLCNQPLTQVLRKLLLEHLGTREEERFSWITSHFLFGPHTFPRASGQPSSPCTHDWLWVPEVSDLSLPGLGKGRAEARTGPAWLGPLTLYILMQREVARLNSLSNFFDVLEPTDGIHFHTVRKM